MSRYKQAVVLLILSFGWITGCKTDDNEMTRSEYCTKICQNNFECLGRTFSQSDCESTCESDIMYDEEDYPSCVDLIDKLNICLAKLNCEQYEVYIDHMYGDSYPCESQKNLSDECIIEVDNDGAPPSGIDRKTMNEIFEKL